jgi:hypothetical protein
VKTEDHVHLIFDGWFFPLRGTYELEGAGVQMGQVVFVAVVLEINPLHRFQLFLLASFDHNWAST